MDGDTPYRSHTASPPDELTPGWRSGWGAEAQRAGNVGEGPTAGGRSADPHLHTCGICPSAQRWQEAGVRGPWPRGERAQPSQSRADQPQEPHLFRLGFAAKREIKIVRFFKLGQGCGVW